MSREQIIRDTAYAIWEAEGKPHGRAVQHWKQAEERVAASLTGSTKPPAKSKAAGAGSAAVKPRVKAAAAPVAAKPVAKKTSAGKSHAKTKS